MEPPPYDRKATRRAALARSAKLPRVSGKASALVLTLCFALAAGLVLPLDAQLGLPTWVRVETVLAGCWFVWVVALTSVLYHGQQVSHDHEMKAPRNWASAFKGVSLGHVGDLAAVGEGCGEGCLWVVAVVGAVLIAFVGFWFLIEVAIPGVAFIVYFLIRGMLARVANDEHGCAGRFGRALAWGGLWATIYMAPLALLTWVGHLIMARAHAA
jgi:hypothetical protein